MIDFFSPASNDASLEYLGKIFGNVNGVIPHGGDLTILGTMFETFNSIILAVGALIVVYTTVVGVMMTAHEGEFMKKWNSLWTPIRAVVGIASLFPTATGYSAIQIIMMWVIVQGVGAADTLWTTALSFTNAMGSPFAQISVPIAGTSTNMAALFQAVTCDQSARSTYASPDGSDSGGYYCGPGNPCFNAPLNLNPDDVANTTYSFGPWGACGRLTYCSQVAECANPDALSCKACKAQAGALATIIPVLRDLATRFIQVDYEYQNFFSNGFINTSKANPDVPAPAWIKKFCEDKGIPPSWCRGPAPLAGFSLFGITIPIPGMLPPPNTGLGSAPKSVVRDVYWTYAMAPDLGGQDFVKTVTAEFQKALQDVANEYLERIKNEIKNKPLGGQYAEAQKKGWIFAGAYYYTLAQSNESNLKQSFPSYSVVATDPATGTKENPNPLRGYRNNSGAAAALRSAVASAASASLGGGGTKNIQMGDEEMDTSYLSDGGDSVGQAMQVSMSGSNPLVDLAMAGYILLTAAQVIFFVFLALSIALGLVSGINAFVLGTGAFNPMAVMTPVIYMIIVPLLGALLGIMVSMGATLGVYVPLIPYTIFTFGAIGWLTSTIETMVAGPLVALGILAPGGHHEILGKAEPALMLLFNVFLRPSLMIFGLVAALLLSSVVMLMINSAFWQIVAPQIVGTATGAFDARDSGGPGAGTIASMAGSPLTMVFFLVAYVGLIVSALNKCFAAIHIIPEKVMRWIGSQGDQYGESEAVGEMKRGIEGAAASTGSGMKAAGKTMEGIGESKGKIKAKKAKDDYDASQANLSGRP